jgi:hypothetical protein
MDFLGMFGIFFMGRTLTKSSSETNKDEERKTRVYVFLVGMSQI